MGVQKVSHGADKAANDQLATRSYGAGHSGAATGLAAAALPSISVGGVTCTTSALNPHPSAHVPGQINAEIRQVCNVSVAKNSTEAKLWESRWWGYNIIAGPSYSALTTSKSSSAFVNAACRTNSIRVTGYGHFELGGLHFVSQEVSNTQNVSC
jgi:hypothetical protein